MLKVLVIDDDETVGTLIKDVLEEQPAADIKSYELEKLFGKPKNSTGNRCKFTVVRKVTGSEGIKALRDSMLTGERIALAFIDITLSDMNGLEVGYQLGKIDDKLKIVYISGWELPDVFSGGATGNPGDSGCFIQKPFRADEILHHATTLCGNLDREADAKMAKMHAFLNLNLIKYN